MFSYRKKVLIASFLLLYLIFPLGCQKTRVPPMEIDLEQIDFAFKRTEGNTMQKWMENFEKAVNEIYTGEDVVFLQANRPEVGKLVMLGYLDKNKKPRYQANDKLLFKIKQIQGSHRFTYRLEDGHGWTFRRSHYGSSSRPGVGTFLLYAFVTSAMWNSLYTYTPMSRRVSLFRYRTTYRGTSAYRSRKTRFRQSRRKYALMRRRSSGRYRSKLSSFKKGSRYRSRGSRYRSSGGKW